MTLTKEGRSKTRRPKGPITQREAITLLSLLIDDAMAKNSTAHRDIARAKVRTLLKPDETWWQTGFVYTNLSIKRCKYLAGMGLPIPMRFLSSFDKVRPGVDKPDRDE